ncbi:MAG: methionine adenosyltransferase [Patescibacteria group bacterium]|nr:methionine adenosyltransferase [Patescibacteria group bacterium]MDE2015526.1 methionine adenosyltransferase [Patescibacteria group bacterium]MDE2226858.1 methionine adenosyltransferase [Patescibacteria group bacterium]
MLRTAESVTIGHPDKVCDQIVDALLDEYLKQDPNSRVAIEALGAHGKLVVTGEVTSSAKVDVPKIARAVYADIGYDESIEVEARIVAQSPEIAQGVDTGGAGDQGIMVGYATNETPEMLPKPVVLARKLAKKLEDIRKAGNKNIGPDGKTQVTMLGEKIITVLVSTQHTESFTGDTLRDFVIKNVIEPVIVDLSGVKILVNPTGKFVIGGFTADSGLSGRKLVVDNYGPDIPIGGGSYAGKDPTKVDRSAAYAARYLAKYLVKKYGVKEALVKIAYAIGVKEPLMVEVERTGMDEKLAEDVRKNFDLSPQGIIKLLDLRRPIYLEATRKGNFGNDSLPWEKV